VQLAAATRSALKKVTPRPGARHRSEPTAASGSSKQSAHPAGTLDLSDESGVSTQMTDSYAVVPEAGHSRDNAGWQMKSHILGESVHEVDATMTVEAALIGRYSLPILTMF